MEIRSRNDLKDFSNQDVKTLADEGNRIAIFEYGMRMYNEDQYEEAFKYPYSIVDADNFFIWQRIYDLCYYVKDALTDKQKFELLCKIHEKGSGYYSYVLSEYYKNGIGCRRSLKKYIELLTICANDGSRYATIELAENYEKGFGVKKSLRKAFKLYDYYVDEHCKRDPWCVYKASCYRLQEIGGAKRDMVVIERDLYFAARWCPEAKKLYIETFNKEPEYK